MIRKVLLATFALLVFALTGALVEAGMAVSLPNETADYVAAKADAKAKGIGVWRGPFTAPADYREMLAGHPQGR